MKLKFIKNVLSNKKKSSFLSVVIVLFLNYVPNSVQIDSDIRADPLIKSLDCLRGVALLTIGFVSPSRSREARLSRKWSYGWSAPGLGTGCSSPGRTSGLHASLRSGRKSREHLACVTGRAHLVGSCVPSPSS